LQRLPLRAGKVDFAPILAMAAILAAAHFGQRGLAQLYQDLQ
jgi:hypothetical protein